MLYLGPGEYLPAAQLLHAVRLGVLAYFPLTQLQGNNHHGCTGGHTQARCRSRVQCLRNAGSKTSSNNHHHHHHHNNNNTGDVQRTRRCGLATVTADSAARLATTLADGVLVLCNAQGQNTNASPTAITGRYPGSMTTDAVAIVAKLQLTVLSSSHQTNTPARTQSCDTAHTCPGVHAPQVVDAALAAYLPTLQF